MLATVPLASVASARRDRLAAGKVGNPPLPGPALVALRAAAQRLTEAGHLVFSLEDLRRELGPAGRQWTSDWLRHALAREARDPERAVIVKLRRGSYTLRATRPDAASAAAGGAAAEARGHVLAAVRSLVGDGPGAAPVNTAQIREQLAAAGVPYCTDSVRRALSQLARQEPAALVRVRQGAYRIP
ncbi:hypothetical protein ACFP3Q_10690 [Nocardioides sp. GCM10027113]|uniref:hypothetical protein n=1 Tax=unclassified Nocardioides TaxID=2615069 RepID=UPI003608B260